METSLSREAPLPMSTGRGCLLGRGREPAEAVGGFVRFSGCRCVRFSAIPVLTVPAPLLRVSWVGEDCRVELGEEGKTAGERVLFVEGGSLGEDLSWLEG